LNFHTQKEAKKLKCPVARTFGDGKKATCDGDACLLWRWRELSVSDHRVLSAYARVQQDMLAKEPADTKKTANSFHKAAVQKVAAAPWDFIFMTDDDRGFCGLGGKP
tara:strand:+ start:6701 stop:7021 length:321 start_codon:yes stop_codon:yes gene_type:complete